MLLFYTTTEVYTKFGIVSNHAVVSFLFCMASAVCVVACVVLALLAVALFIGGQTLGGIVFLVLAFLISPYGIPSIAEWLVDKLHNLNFALRDFITS